ncbi:MAG: hypothetical protein ABI818_04400 [Acidobacteriota bacterium]
MIQAHVGLVGCGRWSSLLLRDLRALGARVAVVARSDAGCIQAQTGNADEIVGRIVEPRGVDPFADHNTIYRGDATAPEPPLAPERVAVSARVPLEIMLAETLQFLRGAPPPRTSAADRALAVGRLAGIAACARTR